jgi:hypothetical protein
MVDFCSALESWWQEEHGEGRRAPSNKSIGRALRSMEGMKFTRDRSHRYVVGVKLNEAGRDYWTASASTSALTGRGVRTSSRVEDTVRPLNHLDT